MHGTCVVHLCAAFIRWQVMDAHFTLTGDHHITPVCLSTWWTLSLVFWPVPIKCTVLSLWSVLRGGLSVSHVHCASILCCCCCCLATFTAFIKSGAGTYLPFCCNTHPQSPRAHWSGPWPLCVNQSLPGAHQTWCSQPMISYKWGCCTCTAFS